MDGWLQAPHRERQSLSHNLPSPTGGGWWQGTLWAGVRAMPNRPFGREWTFLFPPTLDELVPADHPARYVAMFVDGLTRADWLELGVAPDGGARGAPGYAPQALLGAWLYGFMTGVRSSRKLEGACRDRVPYLWLTGWQRPDHNTLWRFYRAHRTGMRVLLKRTVRVAIETGLVDLAVQAVDGTRPARLPAELARMGALRARVEEALARVTDEDGPARANVTDPDATLQTR